MRRTYAIFLCFLILFSVFSAVNFSVEAQSPSGNISFQPNSIPEVNVYYSDYSFVFEYKSYFIRIRPFVIYNETYYGMKQIVTWIKNNYPNVDYKWLVDKATDAIHYGFNLTKLPQNVADKIDYLGFRLVDLNFPLSWFELETVELYDNEYVPYNVTRIYIEKANLYLSFEDLYPQGYSVMHVNSTYVLVGNVRSKVDLIIDPITFSSPVITVTGATGIGDSWATAFNFWDLWNASNVNGWNVVRLFQSDNMTYEFGCRIIIGGISTHTYFWDRNVQVTFNSTAVSGNSQYLIEVRYRGHLRFGQLDDSTNKLTSRGCQITAVDSGYTYIAIIYGQSNDADIQLYSSSFISTSPSGAYSHQLRSLRNNAPVYNCAFDNVYFNTADIDGYRITMVLGSIPLSRSSGTFDDIYIQQSSDFYVYWYQAETGNLKNLKAIGNTGVYGSIRCYSITVDHNITNGELDSWSFAWDGTSTGEVYRQYEFDATFYFKNGSQAQNANVTISNDYLGTSDSWLTYANGSIPTQTYSYGHYNQTGGDSIYDYNPYNLTVTLDGYETYTDLINITQKEDLRITLTDEVKTNPVARFEFSPERAYIDETVTFDATNSTDPDGGSISTYSWDYGDSGSGSGVTATHSYSSVGKYWVELTVTDDESATDSTGLWVNITDYDSPTARFTFTPSNPEQRETITFDASGSTDRDGSISSYSWSFGDDTTASTSTATKSYESVGTFTVTLTVTDNQGKTDSTTQNVVVENPPSTSDGGAGPAPGTTPPTLPIDTSNIALLLSWNPDTFTYYPIIDQNYAMNFTVTNNATVDQSVTVCYWLNNSSNETVWWNTYSFFVEASSEVELILTYPIERDGTYTAYAQVIAPTPTGKIQEAQFTAMSGMPLRFFIIIVAVILVLAIANEQKKKRTVNVEER